MVEVRRGLAPGEMEPVNDYKQWREARIKRLEEDEEFLWKILHSVQDELRCLKDKETL